MAKLWISLLFFAYLVEISCALETHSLVLTDEPLFNYGVEKGHDVPDNLDNIAPITLKLNISYFGSSFNELYVSKDGTIGFQSKAKYINGITWSKGIKSDSADIPFIAPFYYNGYDPTSIGQENYPGKIFHHVMYESEPPQDTDANLRFYEEEKVRNYLTYYVKEAVLNAPKDFIAKVVVVVTWADVAHDPMDASGDCSNANPCKSATFQAAIVADEKNTYVIFNYKKMEIEQQPYYQAGCNGGYERGWLSAISCDGNCEFTDINLSNTSLLNEMHNLRGSDMQGRFVYDVGGDEVARAGCIPPNLEDGKLEVYPRNVRMFGGEKLQVSGKCMPATQKVYCKFGDSNNHFKTEGEMINGMRGYCTVPKMTLVGSTQVEWSSDGETYSVGRKISVVSPWSLYDLEHQDSEAHIQAWFAKDSSSISVKWLPELMSSNSDARVEVKLIGYRETSSKVEFKTLENMGEAQNSDGQFTFETDKFACTKDCKEFQVGLLEVALITAFIADANKRVAIRFGPMPLGWYVNKELSDKVGSDWPEDMCHKWHHEDARDKAWLKELPKCPCSLDQALADFGRWQAHPDCNVFTGTKCLLQSGAKHCVMSMHTTSSGAGNECCYFADGSLMYRQLTVTAGGPSRKTIRGSSPYNKPGTVPVLSSAKSDILPYIHCCFWAKQDSDLCHEFTKLRPTTDCDTYQVPGLAFVRGEAHITTFDGSTYHFGAMGDYWLFKHTDLSIQGRFEYRRDSWDLGTLAKLSHWKPKALTHLSIKGRGAETILVHPAPDNAVVKRGLDITVGKEKYFFFDELTKRQEFGDAIIINNAKTMKNNPHSNFTIIIQEVGINIVAVNNMLQVIVALPPSMKDSKTGRGLLGAFDGMRDNDYISREGLTKSTGTDPETLFNTFAITWAVKNEESLFPLFKGGDQFKDEQQYYKYDEIPHAFTSAPTDAAIANLCGDDDNCKWDYRISGKSQIAKATKEADQLFSYMQGSAYLVENCGLPKIGEMATLSSYNFSAGKDITVTGCSGDHSFDGKKEFKCMMEKLTDAEDKDRDDYGRKTTYNQVKYIVHWVPEPYTICSEDGSSSASMSMIIGIVVGVIVVIIIAIVLIVLIKKKRRGGSKEIQKPRPADRVRQDQDFEEGTDEPMMSQSRKPVYNPKKQESRSSSAV